MTNKNAGPKADGINSDERRWYGLGPTQGVWPVHPKRKRGFIRALKRKEPWALREKAWRDLLNDTVKTMYEYVMKPNPMLGLWKNVFDGESVPVKIEYGNPKK